MSHPEKPLLVRMWHPRQGRFVWGVVPCVLQGFQTMPTQQQREWNRRAYNWRAEQMKKETT